MLTIAFPENQRGLAIGIYGAIGTVFLAMGPFVGGLLTDFLSWRWIFWSTFPLSSPSG
jgi:MFS family permease